MPEPTTKAEIFDRLCAKAKKAGLLKFCQDGIAVIRLDPPAPDAAIPEAPVTPPAQ